MAEPSGRNAFARLLSLYELESGAVARMVAGDGYSDFFVEGSGPPWHEAFGDSAKAEVEFSATRMAFVDAISKIGRLRAGDGGDGGYSDFFVEGSGPPWHEAFGDAGLGDVSNPAMRAQALSTMRVIQAYARARQAARR